jgi:hypothetical protein
MIYLIGGAPRVGKSQFAQKLITARPMPSFSCDFLYDLAQIRQIPNFEYTEILERGRLFYPTLQELLINIKRRSQDCVLDGEVILPEFIPELAKTYDIRSCFLGLSDTNLETILKHGGYFNWPQYKLEHHLEIEVHDLAERTVGRSQIIEVEAKKYQVSYFDLASDYDATVKLALNSLLS